MQKGILKKIIVILSCGAAVNAHAMGNGFYMGVMMGPATNNAPSLQAVKAPAPANNLPPSDPNSKTSFTTTVANPRSSMFATRIYMGNQFNTYAGIEFGGTFYSSIRYDSRGVQTVGSTSQRVRDLDLVLKGIFPINSFSLYGKLGMAAIYLTSGSSFNPTFKPATPAPVPPSTVPYSNSYFSTSTTYKHKFAPTLSIGASYDINQSWQVDASLNSLQVGNNVGTLTFFAVGFSYHFTDKYCGQFLCDD
jgi:hypothetical protein